MHCDKSQTQKPLIPYYNLVLRSKRSEFYVTKLKLVSFSFQDYKELGREKFHLLWRQKKHMFEKLIDTIHEPTHGMGIHNNL